jgi:hypothetical protein
LESLVPPSKAYAPVIIKTKTNVHIHIGDGAM